MALSPGLFARARLPLSPVLPPITGPVGNGMDNDPADVEAVKRGLNALGYYTVPDYGFTGYIDQATTDAVKRFQQDNGLKQDGWLGKDGETYTAINDRLGQLPQGVDPKADGAQQSLEARASTTQGSAAPAKKGVSLLDGQLHQPHSPTPLGEGGNPIMLGGTNSNFTQKTDQDAIQQIRGPAFRLPSRVPPPPTRSVPKPNVPGPNGPQNEPSRSTPADSSSIAAAIGRILSQLFSTDQHAGETKTDQHDQTAA